jgi:hypothetical protein
MPLPTKKSPDKIFIQKELGLFEILLGRSFLYYHKTGMADATQIWIASANISRVIRNHLNSPKIWSMTSLPLLPSESARTLGRDTTGDVGAKIFFDALGLEGVAEGIEDMPSICKAVHQFFARTHTATKVKLLRAKCNHETLRESLAAANVDEERWSGLIDLFADHLALDFVTPLPLLHRVGEALPLQQAYVRPLSTGGTRTSSYMDKEGDTLTARQAQSGKLYDTYLFKEDFDHLNLPLMIIDKHVKLISHAAAEAIISRQGSMNWGQAFEDVLDRDLSGIFGGCPQREAKRGWKKRRMDEDCIDDEEPVAVRKRAWTHVMHNLAINLRSSKAQACQPHSAFRAAQHACSRPHSPHSRHTRTSLHLLTLLFAASLCKESSQVGNGGCEPKRQGYVLVWSATED